MVRGKSAEKQSTALAYLRTSSAQNVGGDSVDRQRAAITRFAQSHGYVLVGEFYDAAVSGADPIETRPGFAAMIERIEGNGVRVVIVEDASRFARSVVAQELGVFAMQTRGVRVLTAGGENLTSTDDPVKVMMRQIAGAFAQYEKARLVAKLKGARDRHSTELGHRIEGRKGYGETLPELVREAKRSGWPGGARRRARRAACARSRPSSPRWAIARPRVARSRPHRSSGCSRVDLVRLKVVRLSRLLVGNDGEVCPRPGRVTGTRGTAPKHGHKLAWIV
jgi:DNA invertase Pin-like site-specific DNA recombinase